jgi:hypothetical protein
MFKERIADKACGLSTSFASENRDPVNDGPGEGRAVMNAERIRYSGKLMHKYEQVALSWDV